MSPDSTTMFGVISHSFSKGNLFGLSKAPYYFHGLVRMMLKIDACILESVKKRKNICTTA